MMTAGQSSHLRLLSKRAQKQMCQPFFNFFVAFATWPLNQALAEQGIAHTQVNYVTRKGVAAF